MCWGVGGKSEPWSELHARHWTAESHPLARVAPQPVLEREELPLRSLDGVSDSRVGQEVEVDVEHVAMETRALGWCWPCVRYTRGQMFNQLTTTRWYVINSIHATTESLHVYRRLRACTGLSKARLITGFLMWYLRLRKHSTNLVEHATCRFCRLEEETALHFCLAGEFAVMTKMSWNLGKHQIRMEEITSLQITQILNNWANLGSINNCNRDSSDKEWWGGGNGSWFVQLRL